jgi:hypothetical protein
MNTEALRVILISFLIAIFLVSLSYLRRRKMSKLAYAFWGVFALLLPAFGPFYLIAYRPGKLASRKHGRQRSRTKRRQNIRI